jgi:hypothetical protein
MKATSLSLLLLASSPMIILAQTTQVPNLLSYQANVTDAAGNPIGATNPVNRTVTFKFYTTSTSGTPVYAESQVVTIANGDFSVLLGNGNGVTGLPGRVAPASPIRTLASITLSPLYLGITVDDGTAAADPEISPRQQMASAAFATRAQVAEGLADSRLSTTMVADSAITEVKIGSSQVTTTKIADANITTAKLAPASVTLDKLDTSAIGIWTPNGPNINRTSGNVGIGETNPGFPLNFASSNGNKIALNGNTGAHYGLGVQSNLLQLYTVNSSADVAFGYGSSTAFTETMRIKGNGNLGIGTTTPSSKLHVVGGSATIDSTANTLLSVLQGGGTGRVDLALASAAGTYSSSAAANDAILRTTTGKLHLQTGAGASAITVDAANNVGVGTVSPVNKLDVRGKLSLGDAGPDVAYNGALQITRPTTGAQHINLVRSGSMVWSLGYVPNSNTFGIGTGTGTDSSFNPQFRIDTNGKVGIGVASPAEILHVNGTIRMNGTHSSNSNPAYASINYSNNGVAVSTFNSNHSTGDRTALFNGDANWDFSSDARLKKNIQNAEPVLERLLQVQLRRFQWHDDANTAELQFGVIAQEILPLFPDIVTKSILPGQKEETYMVGYTTFGTLAVKGLQELKIEKDDEIDGLRADLEEKDAQIANLNARLLALEKLVSGNR